MATDTETKPRTRSRSAAPSRAANGTWEFWFDRGPGLNSKGEWRDRRRVHRGGFATKAVAQSALDDLRVDSRKGTFVDPSKVTVREYLLTWLDELPGTNAAKSTVYSYRRNLERHVIDRIGGHTLQGLKPGHLKQMYADLQAPGANLRSKDQGLSPRSVRYIHSILHRALAEAVGAELLMTSPAAREKLRAPSPRSNKAEKVRWWTPEEMSTFLRTSAEENDPDHDLWRLLLATGARRGEALGLRWGDVDLDAEPDPTVAIRQSVVTVNHVVHVEPTKTGKDRNVEIDTGTAAMLDKRRVRLDEQRDLLGMAPLGRNDLVFAELDGSPLHPEAASKRLDRRVKRYGLPHVGTHGLRHTHAVALLKKGVHPKVVQERLGHANIAMTMDTYSHVLKGMGGAAAKMFAELLDDHETT